MLRVVVFFLAIVVDSARLTSPHPTRLDADIQPFLWSGLVSFQRILHFDFGP